MSGMNWNRFDIRRKKIYSLLIIFILAGLAACGGESKAPRDSSVASSSVNSFSSHPGGSSSISSSSPSNSSSAESSSSNEPTSSSEPASSSSANFSVSTSQATSSSSSVVVSSSSASSAASSSSGVQEVRAFPGAEGFGAMVTGGRGGRVIKVTTLNPSGVGSLREALAASGARIIVFDVSGTIQVPGQGGKFGGILYIENGNVTIAGQTAPGAGITIEGRLNIANTSNVIVRHLRIRPEYDGSDPDQFDAIQIYQSNHIMLDHVSTSFGVDETIDVWSAQDLTVQWSTIESAHDTGDGHNYGLHSGEPAARISVLNNLFAHNARRNPSISNGPADVINNVMYNVRHAFHHDDPAANLANAGQFNVASNYFKTGPTNTFIPMWFVKDGYEDYSSFYYAVGNWMDLSAGNNSQCPAGEIIDPRCDNEDNHDLEHITFANTPFSFSSHSGWRAPTIKSAGEAYAQMIAKVGALPRDVVTRRTIAEMQAGTGSWGSRRESVNMMDGLTPGTAPLDSDGDGMSDAWEAARIDAGLSPHTADHNTIMPSGYTAIEDYINQLADELINQ